MTFASHQVASVKFVADASPSTHLQDCHSSCELAAVVYCLAADGAHLDLQLLKLFPENVSSPPEPLTSAELSLFPLGTQVVIYHGGKRTTDPAELAAADVVLTTYSIVESEFRRNCLPGKVLPLRARACGNMSDVSPR